MMGGDIKVATNKQLNNRLMSKVQLIRELTKVDLWYLQQVSKETDTWNSPYYVSLNTKHTMAMLVTTA